MPVIFHQETEPDLRWAVWKITETESELLQNIQLSEKELQTILSLKLQKRRVERLACRNVISFLLHTAQVKVLYGQYGEPLMEGYHLSLSHSGHFAAAAISSRKRVGIDIEKISSKFITTQYKFVSPKEAAYIDPGNPKEIAPYWCAKEATYKLFPEKKPDFLYNIDVDIKKSIVSLHHQNEIIELNVQFQMIDDYCMAIVF